MTSLVEKLRAKREERTRLGYGELGRVLSLPVAQAPSPAELDALRARIEKPGGLWKLRDIQLDMLYEAQQAGGLVGAVGVGHGKTLVTLCASLLVPCKRPLLLVPSARVVEKTWREAEQYDQHFNLDGRLRIMTYGELSRAEGEDTLESLRPDLIIADEADNLAGMTAARTLRMARYIIAHAPKFIALTGTLTKTSIRDYAHLCEWALGPGSPLPMEWVDLERWSICIDADENIWPTLNDWRSLQPLVDQFGRSGVNLCNVPTRTRRQCIREAYRARLTSTRGVVVTDDMSTTATLNLERLDGPKCPEIDEALKLLEDYWERPDGELLTTALEVAEVGRQISLGFYYYWDWPDGQKDEEWLEARANWNRNVRRVLKRPIRGYDTPALLEEALVAGVTRFTRDTELVEAYEGWLPVKDRPKPPTQVRWLTKERVKWVVELAEPGAILWYGHEAIGEALRGLGVKVYRGGQAPPVYNDGTVVGLSIKSHGVGFNLQDWNVNYIIGAPSSARLLEQMLGRTHRDGQTADVYGGFLTDSGGFLSGALDKAITRAHMIRQTQGTEQKILVGF